MAQASSLSLTVWKNPANPATYDESNEIKTTTTTGVPIFRIDVDTAAVTELGWFYSDPGQPADLRLESMACAVKRQHLWPPSTSTVVL